MDDIYKELGNHPPILDIAKIKYEAIRFVRIFKNKYEKFSIMGCVVVDGQQYNLYIGTNATDYVQASQDNYNNMVALAMHLTTPKFYNLYLTKVKKTYKFHYIGFIPLKELLQLKLKAKQVS